MMSDIRDSIGLQFARIKALEGISEARKILVLLLRFLTVVHTASRDAYCKI